MVRTAADVTGSMSATLEKWIGTCRTDHNRSDVRHRLTCWTAAQSCILSSLGSRPQWMCTSTVMMPPGLSSVRLMCLFACTMRTAETLPTASTPTNGDACI